MSLQYGLLNAQTQVKPTLAPSALNPWGNPIGQAEIAIIPEPVSLMRKEGFFELPQNVVIAAPSGARLASSVNSLRDKIQNASGHFVSVINDASSVAHIKLQILDKGDASLGKEGYSLTVNSQQVVIKANNEHGLFYGIQTLLQLFPKEIESKEIVEAFKWTLPCVEIKDFPRVAWRGLMFDVSRHFFTVDEVKQFIENMSRYKYNKFHFHLTDDEGWRIEIKGYPKLTEVGAWSVKKEGTFGDFIPPGINEPRTYGGFFTQEDLKEIVAFAQDRFIDVMPEVDVPGHSLAAIASYPDLSCTPEAVNYKVRSGEKIMDWSRGAPPLALVDNTLCPANEKVYVFIDSVVSQLARIFPFEYIHLGGDEAPHNFWEKNEQIKALMKREGLKTIPEVQAYFEKRVEKIVRAKGKKMVAWDEVLEGGVPNTMTIMAWRSMEKGIEAAKKGHEVIMTPTQFAYLDYMQADEITEPRVYASLRLAKTYEFDPIPEGVDPKLIKGGQGNLWTEQIFNIRQAEYMVWPRGFALAESMWSPREKKDWSHFIAKTEKHFERLDLAETKYSPAMYDPSFAVRRTADKLLQVTLKTEIEGLDIYYSFDNSAPDRFYPKYTEPLIVPVDAGVLKIVTYKGKQQVGRILHMPITELNKRAGK
ncbi:MAG: beta-N-acetylhexosaminidase [Pedobacter sp.]|nr:MAG: beta-N-acetylhexosaminidase [Pedobacter sp.]